MQEARRRAGQHRDTVRWMGEDAYFTTDDGVFFVPTGFTRGPWDVDACHAGPPAALLARASELHVPDKPLVRLLVELNRPIPMSGFSIDVETVRPGRTVTATRLILHDAERTYAVASGLHLAEEDLGTVPTHQVPTMGPEEAVPGDFPVREYHHEEMCFPASLEVRYDPSFSYGQGGETFMWARSVVPILPGEEPSTFQRVCPVADSGNGISWHLPATEMLFLNADLLVSVHRPMGGEWVGSHCRSYWEPTSIGRADAELFDADGPIGRALQHLILRRP